MIVWGPFKQIKVLERGARKHARCAVFSLNLDLPFHFPNNHFSVTWLILPSIPDLPVVRCESFVSRRKYSHKSKEEFLCCYPGPQQVISL